MRAPLTWTGTRDYPNLRINGRAARVLRRPENIRRPAYLATLERMTPTLGHPKDRNGQNVLINPENYAAYAVGSVGDTISMEMIDGYEVPIGNITIVRDDAIASIEAGNDQVSQGFFALLSPPPEDERADDDAEYAGVWQGPHGPEPYDFEHICDADHPVARAYAEEHPDFPLAKLGANHLAVGIPRGRGAAQAQARPLAGYDEDASHGAIVFLDTYAPTDTDTDTMPKKQIKWSPKLPKDFSGAVPCFDAEMDASDGDMMMEFLGGMQSLISSLMERAAMAESDAEKAMGEKEMMAEKVVEVEKEKADMTEAMDSLTAERDALAAEVAPLRVAALETEKTTAAKVAPGVVLDACDSIADVRKAAVVAKLPHFADASDAKIEGAWSVLVAALDSTPEPAESSDKLDAKPSPNFMAVADEAPAPTVSAGERARKLLNR